MIRTFRTGFISESHSQLDYLPDFNAANCSGLILIILGALFC